MPFDYEIDQDAGLVTVHAKDGVTPAEAVSTARQLLRDHAVGEWFGLLVVVDPGARESTPQELRDFAEVLKLFGQKLRGRKAIVATDVGRVTTARIVALIASTHGDVEAFTSEGAARAWVSAVPSAG